MELLVTIIILALIFDYINGFHDAANSIATIVSTRVLTPFQAVLWAAFFNFVAFFIAKYIIGGFGIANTVSKTVVEQYITLPIILAGVIAAITWNLITWWKGIPSSSSHTLIGGFAGAAIMANGFEAIQLNIILKIAAFIFLAPFIGMVIAFGFTLFVLYICRRAHPHTAEQWFKRLQLVSSALFSVGHGLNDSQKVMGICRNSRCFHSLHHGNVENSCKYDTYYHRSNHRSRRNKTPFCCSLGSYQKPDDGLDSYNSGQRTFSSRCLFYCFFIYIIKHIPAI